MDMSFFRGDTKKQIGGVIIYAKSHFDTTVRDDLCLKQQSCEDKWLRIKIDNHKPI